jgi:stage V sporulation protein B
MKTKKQSQSLLSGAIVLMIATGIVKVIGMVFKIPMTNFVLEEKGMAYFTSAYNIFLVFYSLAIAGLPVAVSRMVAESIAVKNYKETKSLLKVSLKIFAITGTAGLVLLLAFSVPYVRYIKSDGALLSVLTIAPTILFCCIMSAYRGYYQGQKNMMPTAISQVIEALGKLFLGLGFAFIVRTIGLNEFSSKGTIFGKAVETEADAVSMLLPYCAAAAILGIAIGTVLATLYLFLYHKIVGDKITPEEIQLSPESRSQKDLIKALFTIAIPILLASVVLNLTNLIDTATIQNRLDYIMRTSPNALRNIYGATLADAKDTEISEFLYGAYASMAMTMYNLIPTITTAFGTSAIPTLSTAWAQKNKESVKSSIESVFKYVTIISAPAGIGLCVLAKPILSLLYSQRPNGVAVSVIPLQILGIIVIFTALTMPTCNMLQAIGKQKVPVINMAIGAVIKITVNYILVSIPAININAAPIGTALCYGYILIANVVVLAKTTGAKINFFQSFIKPVIAGAICGLSALAGYGLLTRWFGNAVSTLGSIAFAGIIYLISALLLGVLSKEDIKKFKKS